MLTVLFLIAPGFEPLEATAPIDYLRRAGATVVLAAVGTEKLGVNAMFILRMFLIIFTMQLFARVECQVPKI